MKRFSKQSEQNAHYFKFRDEWRKSKAKGNCEEFERLKNQGFFNDNDWKMLVEKYNAKNVGNDEIEIALETIEDLKEFLADIDVADVEYIPFKETFVHKINW